MGFSITSAVFGGIIILVYSAGINSYGSWPISRKSGSIPSAGYKHDTQMALSAIILILGIVEFVIGILAPVCLCLMKPCTCCKFCHGTAPQQVSVTSGIKGLIILPFPKTNILESDSFVRQTNKRLFLSYTTMNNIHIFNDIYLPSYILTYLPTYLPTCLPACLPVRFWSTCLKRLLKGHP